ncbi:hypothetical protein GCM10008956_26640 [Deinococcus arenae]|uniref:Uncharacterized protein n=1 Tax=Deinococcus arenae TaxID=1452751 RepID=A0A8H9L7V4_9DEIO|nr:hypothetical protein [Deinococcus arenae]AWT36831.1 hypothetical protein DM785_15705 [Deinococcus actinosclerus]GGM49243.1 hypothetical protein GCM10008956_26640 [Deinococcus arenae]
MQRKRFEAAVDFLSIPEHNAKIHCRERNYKIPGAEKLTVHLQAFRAGETTKVDVNEGNTLDILDWRVVDGLNQMAAADAYAFRQALDTIWTEPLSPRNADRFWAAIDPALDSISPDISKHFNGLGTRASVASYFLFLADPKKFPFYRPSFGGKAMEYLYDRTEALDRASPGALLHDYGCRCAFLLREFRDAGLKLDDMVDLQSALYVMVQDHLKK